MKPTDLYRDCFWCGRVYDIWREEACPSCCSRLEAEGPGSMAGEWNKRPDYNGPDFTEWLEERQAKSDELRRKYGW